jgi:hypothetical protein
VHGFELLWVEAIEAALPGLVNGDEADFSEHTEVLGNGGLGKAEVEDDFCDIALGPEGEEIDNFSASGFGDGVEDVGGCGGTSHWRQYIPIWEYVKGKKLKE